MIPKCSLFREVIIAAPFTTDLSERVKQGVLTQPGCVYCREHEVLQTLFLYLTEVRPRRQTPGPQIHLPIRLQEGAASNTTK